MKKGIISAILVAIFLSVMISFQVKAKSTTPLCRASCVDRNCEGALDGCKCGSYRGWCNCCYCYRCPGDNCMSTIKRDCVPGSMCVNSVDKYGWVLGGKCSDLLTK